jgi:E3 ubiquitin-protein ligase RFWD2
VFQTASLCYSLCWNRDILSSEFINDASAALAERQEAMNAEEKEAETRLLLDFLRWLQLRKQSLVNKLEEEISSLTSDIIEVKRRQSLLHKISTPYDEQSSSGKLTHDRHHTEQVSVKSARLMSNFDKFEKAYFAMRSKVQNEVSKCHSTQEMGSTSGSESTGMKINKMSVAGSCTHQEKDLLGCFFDSICKYARYSRFEVKATLLHGNLLNTSNMVCSLSFDRDQEYFATAGICKRIRIFDYDAVLNEDVDIHYPVVEMMANSKLSSICWNSYIKSHIGSCDYNGVVQVKRSLPVVFVTI